MKNERGITLVEVLAAIVIAAIIGTIAYSIILGGLKYYERVTIEAELRDEADLIVAELIQSLYVLKLSEIEKTHFDDKQSYLELSDGNKLGFFDNKVFTVDKIKNDDGELSFVSQEVRMTSGRITLAEGTKMEEKGIGHYEVTLVLKELENEQKLHVTSEVGVIDDLRDEEEEEG